MVHALDIIRKLLSRDGMLIDIHPTGRPPELNFRSAGVDHFIGHLEETDDFVEYRQAEEAIQEAVQAGWFAILERRLFTFNTYASNIMELKTFLEETWSDIVFPLPSVVRAQAMERRATGQIQVWLSEQVWISSLRRAS